MATVGGTKPGIPHAVSAMKQGQSRIWSQYEQEDLREMPGHHATSIASQDSIHHTAGPFSI